MVCPQCHAEYREGYSSCADCHVALVHDLPRQSHEDSGYFNSSPPPGDPDQDPFCSFWQGDDPRIHAELCELLDEEGIAHKTIRREDHLFNLNSKSAFQVGIPFSQFEKAEAAIKGAYGSEEETQGAARLLPYGKELVTDVGLFSTWLDAARGYANLGRYLPMEMTEEDTSSPESQVALEHPESARENWDPENCDSKGATAEVWCGEQAETGEFIAASLEINQIHARFEKEERKNVIFVLPKDEKRAREIVHEIVEGVPPE
jgi:hypothetical protein